MLDRDELFAATIDSTFLEREHDSDLRSIASRYVDPRALEDLAEVYADNILDLYVAKRPHASEAELTAVRESATQMFVLGFVRGCHALSRACA